MEPALVVWQHVARNPVARAVARRRIETGVRDFLIRLYGLQDGEDVAGDTYAAAQVLAVAIRIVETRDQADSADARVMAGSMGQLVALAKGGNVWKTSAAVAIDQGLQRAVQIINQASAVETQRAWLFVQQMEEACQPA